MQGAPAPQLDFCMGSALQSLAMAVQNEGGDINSVVYEGSKQTLLTKNGGLICILRKSQVLQ